MIIDEKDWGHYFWRKGLDDRMFSKNDYWVAGLHHFLSKHAFSMLLLWWYWSEKTKHSGFSWGREITGQTSGRFLICSPNIHFSSFISDFSRWKIVGFFRNFFTHLQEALLCALLSPSRAWKMKLRKFVIVSLLTALANRKAINPRYRSNRLSFFVQELLFVFDILQW